MFPEFGQSPLCLELDLDSYEGSWTHVAAFRGRGGWLMSARATIQSEHDLMRATLIAACDEYENPIPAWRAEHLTTCDWASLRECRELPPDLLDDLLCEEEGAFFARWQRETNGALVALHERAQHDLATLEARAAALQRRADHEIADLQRRRRQADASPDHRAALSQLIAQIEADSDAAVHAAASRRAALRREIDAAEESLWDRGDVLVEVEPLWCIQWQAPESRRSRATPRVGGNPTRVGGGKAVGAPGQVIASLIVEPPPKPKPVLVIAPQPPAPARAPANAPSPSPAAPPFAESELRRKLAAIDQAFARPGRATPVRRLHVQRAMLKEELARRAGAPAAEPVPPPPPITPPRIDPGPTVALPAPPAAPTVASPPTPPQATAPDPLAGERRDRLALQFQLEDLLAAGARFRAGSPKFRRFGEEVAAVRARIATLDALLGGAPAAPTPEELREERALLAAELAAHEKRGTLASDGARRFLRYQVRRQELMARIARVDRRLAVSSVERPAMKPAAVPARPLPAGAVYALAQYHRDRDRAVMVDAEAVAELANHREGTPQHTHRAIAITRRRARIVKLNARIADLEARMAEQAGAEPARVTE